jgi:hypothetical protein
MDVTYFLFAIMFISTAGGIVITWKYRGPPA